MACVCPKCLNDEFNIFTKRKGIVKIVVNENNESVPELTSEDPNIVGTEFASCTKCSQVIAVDGSDLVDAVICSTCGGYALQNTLDDNGACPGCQIPAELKGLSENEYIRKILDLQKQINAMATPKNDDTFLDEIPDIEV